LRQEGVVVKRFLTMGSLAGVAVLAAVAATAGGASAHQGKPVARHVLLLSVDGLHQSDLAWYVRRHPRSALAKLMRKGVEFTHAQTPFPSDSFPGMVGQVTGGNPKTTGVYYDDSWNNALLPAGTTNCAGATPGAEVTFFEQADVDPLALDAGQGLAGLPDGILKMTGNPSTLIDPAQLPVDPATCKPVYPHSYLKVNTIFEVARAAGLRTAWSDKHPAYEILNGPSGTGIQDLFTPEINSEAPTPGSANDWTTDNTLTMQYDSYKVHAVLNEIDGFDHSGTTSVGTPAIFGMNFQTVSTAEKLPVSGGLTGGYLADGATPGPLLARALDYVDAQIGAMVAEIDSHGLASSTVIIVSAKHGQSPQKPSDLTRIPDGPIIDGLNAAWSAAHPGAGDLVAFSIDDDAMLIWLHDRSAAATSFAKSYLLGHSGVGNDIDGNPKPYTSSGLAQAYAGADAAAVFGVAPGDARVPDVLGIAQHGSVYTGKQGKIAEHGGNDAQDRDVPVLVSGRPLAHGHWRHLVDSPVETTQIAPTILQLLGLDPQSLQAVQAEGTAALPLH
jgi:hypothetical protein